MRSLVEEKTALIITSMEESIAQTEERNKSSVDIAAITGKYVEWRGNGQLILLVTQIINDEDTIVAEET